MYWFKHILFMMKRIGRGLKCDKSPLLKCMSTMVAHGVSLVVCSRFFRCTYRHDNKAGLLEAKSAAANYLEWPTVNGELLTETLSLWLLYGTKT